MSIQAPERTDAPHRKRNVAMIVLAVLAVLAVVGAVAIVTLTGDEGEPGSQPSAAPSAGPSASAAPTASAQPTAPTSAPPAAVPFGYQPLWPFASQEQVQEWQRAYRSGGHQPWHLDAGLTALSFTTGYLRFAVIDTVVSQSVDGNEALVAVGYAVENRAPATAAVLHLVKFGSGADAPWEVVGTKDTTLTLTEPRYGAAVTSPIRVGGKITGVDESIRVQVRQQPAEAPIGEACCLPAGGENTPWSTTVAFAGATGGALTIVASTGGHYTDVERFAITGVQPER